MAGAGAVLTGVVCKKSCADLRLNDTPNCLIKARMWKRDHAFNGAVVAACAIVGKTVAISGPFGKVQAIRSCAEMPKRRRSVGIAVAKAAAPIGQPPLAERANSVS
jgi:hypothetical protein